MQSINFDDYELSSESAFIYVTHKMLEMVEQERETVMDLSCYRWIIGTRVAKSIFPKRPTKIFGYDVVYGDPVKFYCNGINFESGIINPKNCSNCRFGNDGICKYINKCVKSSIDPAPSHWEEMTDAQKLEKAMSNIGTKKLVGDISKGYHYIDTDMAYRLAEQKHRATGIVFNRDNLSKICGVDVSELYPKQMSQLPITNYSKMYVKKEDKDMSKLCISELLGRFSTTCDKPHDLIENVIFSGPCTIVKWSDGDKTIVRCENEDFDKEKGLAMAIVKKFFGTNESKSNYNDIFKKWIQEEKEESSEKHEVIEKAIEGTRYMSIKEFAKKAGVSESTIRRQVSKGQYSGAKKVDGKWMIPVGEV